MVLSFDLQVLSSCSGSRVESQITTQMSWAKFKEKREVMVVRVCGVVNTPPMAITSRCLLPNWSAVIKVTQAAWSHWLQHDHLARRALPTFPGDHASFQMAQEILWCYMEVQIKLARTHTHTHQQLRHKHGFKSRVESQVTAFQSQVESKSASCGTWVSTSLFSFIEVNS